MDKFYRKLCDVQGRIFEMSAKDGYDSKAFITAFMNSDIAQGLDSSFDRTQWAGEEYLYAEFTENNSIPKGKTYDVEVLHWIGYIYRYWHYYTNEVSKKIIRQASPSTMNSNYIMFHSMDPEMAIDNLKEIIK